MDGHMSRWMAMHILGLYSSDVGQAEDNLIKTLKKRCTSQAVWQAGQGEVAVLPGYRGGGCRLVDRAGQSAQ